MLLDRQNDTPFDLNFRVFGTPVRVLPWFWLVTAFLNFELIYAGIHVLLLWILCVFASILLHELGHIWMGMVFGNRGYIIMQGMCGLACGARDGIAERWKRIAVSLAGPGIQFLFFGLILAVLALVRPTPSSLGEDVDWEFYFWRLWYVPREWPMLLRYTVSFLLTINWWWPIINLLPIWPLDGGQVSRELFTWQNRIYGVRNALALSFATALVVTINDLSAAMGGPRIPYLPVGGKWCILFFAIFAFESFMLLQIENARTRSGWRDDDDQRMPWERDPDEWKRG